MALRAVKRRRDVGKEFKVRDPVAVDNRYGVGLSSGTRHEKVTPTTEATATQVEIKTIATFSFLP